MVDALRRLEADGYLASFRAQAGLLVGGGVEDRPEAFRIDSTARFEGDTDPSDEAAVFSITHGPSGTKGTYTVTYGPEMDPDDVDVTLRLG
jgi:hypothetical protein